MMVETILESSQDFGMSNGSLPQWKRELLQRRALRVRPAAPAPAPPPPPPPLPPPVDEDDEELRYGPGIVKRLKSRYLSLALRDAPRRRPSVLRRAASLEHLLDERPPPAPRPARAPRPASIAAPPPHPRRDFVKRARSVDALSRLEEAPSPPPAPRPPVIAPAPPANRAPRPPRRPAPLLRDAERPPPDVVKSTLRKFESVPTRRAAPAARVSAVVRGLEAPRRSVTPDHEPSPPVSPAPAPLSPAPRSPSQSPVPAPMTPPLPTSPAPSLVTLPRAPSPPPSSPSPVPIPVRLDPAPARFDPIPARLDPAPARFDPIPARLDPAPARLETAPARFDPIPARLDPAPPRFEPIPARIDPVPVRPDPIPARPDPVPARPDPAPARHDPAPARLDPAPMEDEFGCSTGINETEMASRVVSRAALEGIARAGSSVRYAFEAARGGSHLPPLAASNPVLVARRVGVIRPMPAAPRPPAATPTGVGPMSNGRRSPPPAPAPAQAERPPWARAVARPRAPASSQATSIVFNFSSRKEVPDYIENDGIVLRSSRRPNLKVNAAGGESGAEESECEADGPVSPLRVRFVNDNVLINGRSSMQAARGDHQRQAKLKLQFDDSLTVTHEYPSETSLAAEDSPLPASAPAVAPASAPPVSAPDASTLADNTHIASAALSRYAPSKTCAAAAPLGLAPQLAPPHHALNNNGVEHSPETDAEAGEQWDAAPWSAARALATDLLF